MTKDGDGGGEENCGTQRSILMSIPVISSQPIKFESENIPPTSMEEVDFSGIQTKGNQEEQEDLGQALSIVQNGGNVIRANHATLQSLLSTPVSGAQMFAQTDAIQVIAVPNTGDMMGLAGDSSGRLVQLVTGDVSTGVPLSKYISLIAIPNPTLVAAGKAQIEGVEIMKAEAPSAELPAPSDAMAAILMMTPPMTVHDLPPGCPPWAMRLKRCEKIGDSYRGYVENEAELDLIMTLHKQQTNSFWGTRQSPSPAKASTRLMWKSQYVPFDGIPFINAGSRAVVMECQYGPRRKGTLGKRGSTPSSNNGDFKQTCPARIYIKKVRKFPAHAVNLSLDKKNIRLAMDKSFHELREQGLETWGEERYYVQLPTEKAHDYHEEENRKPECAPTSQALLEEGQEQPSQASVPPANGGETKPPEARIHPAVLEKIRQMVATGETRLYTIRKQLRRFVVREMFQGSAQVPERHDLTMFPTVNDLKNHIHQALKDIENGILPLIAPVMSPSGSSSTKVEADASLRSCEIKTELSSMWPDGSSSFEGGALPESVTVTLTQSPGDDGHHFISRIETHLSDGSTQVSTSLTPDTAQLLARLYPDLFNTATLQLADGATRPDEAMSPGLAGSDPPENPTSGLDTSSMVEGVHVIGGLDAAHLSSIVGIDSSHNMAEMMEEDGVHGTDPSQTISGISLDTAPSHSVPGLIDPDTGGFAGMVSSEAHPISSLHMTSASLASVLSGVDHSENSHMLLAAGHDAIGHLGGEGDSSSGLTLISTGHGDGIGLGLLKPDTGMADDRQTEKIALHLTSDQELGLVRLENKVSAL